MAKNLGYEAYSAGTKPEIEINPYAIKVMADINIDISSQYPKLVEEINIEKIDIIITVCSNADKNCPVFYGFIGKKIHYSFDDPAYATGTKKEKLKVFYRVRDEIKNYLIKNPL